MKKNYSIVIFVSLLSQYAFSQSTDQNFISTYDVLIEGITDESQITNSNANQTNIYYDGLGRPLQVVQKQYTPNQKDLVQPIKYDEFGRQKFDFLPYASPSTDGGYKTGWDGTVENPGELLNFYTDVTMRVAKTLHPWAEKEFDNSPLNRIIKQGYGGAAWQLDQHPQGFNYRTNIENEVLFFENTSNGWLNAYVYYEPQSLFVSEISDENGNITREFKDKQSRVVMKEIEISIGESAQTYYLYDDFGNLVLVVSPLGLKLGNLAGGNFSQEYIDKFCYEYSYDNRHRMITKKISSKEIEYFVYDKLDRLVFYQDGNLRLESKWLFAKYDILGRAIMTGITWYFDENSREYLQSTHVDNLSQLFESTDQTGAFGYTNIIFPNMITYGEVLTVNFYDTYNYISTLFDPSYNEYTNQGSYFESNAWDYNSGRLTGSAVRVLDDTDTYLYSMIYYDKFGRVIQAVSQNHLGGYDRISNEYDFPGNIKMTLHEHHIDESDIIKEWYQFDYDHGNRLLQVEHNIGEYSESPVIMAKMQYNELGELIEKNLHSEDGGLTFWQSVDYKYNIRGWLTNINRANLGIDNMIIALDENLEALEMVTGVNIDSIHYNITEVIGGRGESNYLKIEISDKKVVEITKEGVPGEYNEEESSETEVIYLYENDSNDAADYYTLQPLNGSSYYVDLGHMRIDDTTSVMDVISQVEDFIDQQLPQQAVEESAQLDVIALQMQIFILNTMGVDYLNEDGGDDLFGMDIYYNVGISNLNSQLSYNGNISSIAWKTTSDENKRGYGFQYDNLNRLTQGNYGEKGSPSYNWDQNLGDFDLAAVLYDLNGNITELARFTPLGGQALDNLDYYYEGNKLFAVDDTEYQYEHLGDFQNGFDSDEGTYQEYFHDANGNLVQDKNKGIFNINYNYLNLPKKIEFTPYFGSNEIVYLYDANGTKLQKKVYQASAPGAEINYIGNFIYDKNESNEDDLMQILTQEGTLNMQDGMQYQYYLKDHLGNNRIMFTKNETTGNMDVLQENHYYPFGMKFAGSTQGNSNKYLYNGKELQDDGFNIGGSTENDTWLDWYDYGARFYDPAIGRFQTVDPLGELIPGINPYHYCYNNPVVLTDPTGMLPGYEHNYIAATFVDQTGKIIDVTDDDDRNIYLVHDPENWDGKSKDGLLIIGQTPEDNTLKGHIGQRLNSENVTNFIFNEADRLGKQEDTWISWIGFAHLSEFAELMRTRDEQLRILAEMKKAEIARAILRLKVMKNNELILSRHERVKKRFTDWGAGRIITRTFLRMYGQIRLPKNEGVAYIFSDNIFEEIDREFDAKNRQIIKKYDERMKDVQNR